MILKSTFHAHFSYFWISFFFHFKSRKLMKHKAQFNLMMSKYFLLPFYFLHTPYTPCRIQYTNWIVCTIPDPYLFSFHYKLFCARKKTYLRPTRKWKISIFHIKTSMHRRTKYFSFFKRTSVTHIRPFIIMMLTSLFVSSELYRSDLLHVAKHKSNNKNFLNRSRARLSIWILSYVQFCSLNTI